MNSKYSNTWYTSDISKPKCFNYFCELYIYIYIYIYLYLYIYIIYIYIYIHCGNIITFLLRKLYEKNASSSFLRMHFWKYHRGTQIDPHHRESGGKEEGEFYVFFVLEYYWFFLHVWIRERYVSGACLVVVVAKIRIFSTISYGNLSK